MSKLICIFKNSLNDAICEDIIKKFNETIKNNETILKIPKNNDDDWNKINRLLYKELLTKVNKYKERILSQDCYSSILSLLTNNLITYNFTIYKKLTNSKEYSLITEFDKSNVLTYIFVLNKIESGGGYIKFDMLDEQIYTLDQGEMYLFPYDLKHIHKYISPNADEQYIICGNLQLEQDNFVVYSNLRNIIK